MKDTAINWILTSGIKIALIIFVSGIVYLAIRKLMRKVLVKSNTQFNDPEIIKRTETLIHTFQNLLLVVMSAIALMMIVGEFGVEIGPIIAAAGVLGIAVGFGAQNLVKDIISGVFILIDDQIRVGDVVQIAGQTGAVEKVGLRMIIIRDASGNVHFIPNSSIDVVTNMTKDFSRYVLDIGVAYKENVDHVTGVLKEIDVELRSDEAFKNDIKEPIEILGLQSFGDSAVIIRARTTTIPGKQWRIGREFNRRIKMRFDDEGIEIPFPQVTLHHGDMKQKD